MYIDFSIRNILFIYTCISVLAIGDQI